MDNEKECNLSVSTNITQCSTSKLYLQSIPMKQTQEHGNDIKF